MHHLPSRPTSVARAIASLALAGFLAAPAVAHAQRSTVRNVSVAFAPGGPSQNGYVDAQVEFNYWFQDCAEGVGFVAGFNPRPHMLVAPHRYWVDGREVQVPPTMQPRDLSSPTLKGTVNGNGISKEISYLYSSRSPNCWTNGLILGQKAQFFAKGATEADKQRVLEQFGFHARGQLPPLRNAEVENHFRAKFAEEKRAEAARVAQARRDSVARVTATRRDSVARAEQARREQAANATRSSSGTTRSTTSSTTQSTTGSTSTSAGSTRAGSSGNATTGTTRQQTEAERQREAEQRAREAQAQRERDAAAARAAEAQRREQARQDSIRIQQTAEALAAGAILVGEGLGKVLGAFEGTGFALGAAYHAPYLPADGARIGLTMTGYWEGIMIPFVEFQFTAGGQDLGTEKTWGGVAIGSIIPKTGFRFLGTDWQPHAALTMLFTSEQIREFNSEERTRKLLTLGITRKARNIWRLEATIFNGEPRPGIAFAHAF